MSFVLALIVVLSTPGLSTPGLSTPGLSTPGLSTPVVARPVVALRAVGLPVVALRAVGLPVVALPAADLPGRADPPSSGLRVVALAPPGDLFGWPLAAGRVVRRFDPPPRPWLAGHRGVDLSGAPADPVRSAGAGTVVYAGVLAGRGVVSVAHAGGLRTTYEPVTPSVAAGVTVPAGGVLGTLDAGHRGCPVDACLHWGLRRGDTYLDPLVLLGLGRVRLLPVGRPPS